MRAGPYLAGVLLALAALGARLLVDDARDWDEAARLGQRGDPEARAGRVAALGRIARRLVGAGRARRELAAMGRAGDPQAFSELRGAILATRSLWTPDAALLDEANRALAAQRAAETLARGGTPIDPERMAAERTVQLARLVATGEPARAGALVALLGATLFLGGLGRLAARGRSRAAGACAAVGLVLLCGGLLWA